MPINQDILIEKSKKFQQSVYESLNISAFSRSKKSAFLCHSHKDEALVKGMLELLKEVGFDIYIDWKDHDMPDTPNVETAKRIQDKINESDIFLFLASGNSKASRWCPWEIGYADSSKKGIYIIPTSDENNTYGNEYLELYPNIDIGSIGNKSYLAVFKAKESKGTLITVYPF